MSAEIQDLSQHHGGHGGIWIFGHRVPTPLLLVGAGGGVLLLFWAMRKKSATGTADSAAGAGQNMPTPPGGPGTDFGFSGYDPVTGLPIPAGASTGAALGGLDPGTGVSRSLVEQRVGSVTHGPPPGITGARATQDRKGVGPSTGRGVMTPAEAAAHYRALGIASSGVMQRTQALIDAQKNKPKPVPKPKQKPPKSQAHVIAPRRV